MRLRLPCLALLTLGAFAALVVAPAAQQQQQSGSQQQQKATPQQPTFRTGVKLVRVDVTATGRGEQPVADLAAEDFEVTEDGITQKIEQFQFVKLDGQSPAGDERSLEIRTQEQAQAEAARDDVRVFAVFLDDYHVDKAPAVMVPLRRALSTFVARLWPTDLVATMDPLTPLSALRFTRSRAELLDTVNKFEGRQGEIFPVKSPVEEAQLSRPDVARLRAEVTLSALASLVVRLGGLREGRKVVIFVSQGPPVFFFQSGNLQDIMREIAQAASRGNVNIYPVDPRGLGMAARGSRDTLYQLAIESGGRVITNTNDPMVGLSKVLADTSAYYVLAYQPTRLEDDGKYHKIQVKVKRPGVSVHARQGYWAPSGKELEVAREAAARTVEPGVARALGTLAEQGGTRRAADVWVGMSRGEGGRTRVAVTWDAPDPTATRLPRPGALEVEVLEDAGGAVLEPARRIGAAEKGTGRHPAEAFSLAPGPATLRMTARSESGSVLDRWLLPIAVPDFNGAPLSLSTPRVYRAQSLAEFRALNAAPDAPPGAERQFARSDRVVVAMDWYGREGGTPEFQAHLLATDGRELAPLPLPPAGAGTLRFELPIGSLGHGTYLLRIRARLGDAAAEQHVAFGIAR